MTELLNHAEGELEGKKVNIKKACKKLGRKRNRKRKGHINIKERAK